MVGGELWECCHGQPILGCGTYPAMAARCNYRSQPTSVWYAKCHLVPVVQLCPATVPRGQAIYACVPQQRPGKVGEPCLPHRKQAFAEELVYSQTRQTSSLRPAATPKGQCIRCACVSPSLATRSTNSFNLGPKMDGRLIMKPSMFHSATWHRRHTLHARHVLWSSPGVAHGAIS